MRIHVTGGSGFLGRYVVRELRDAGHTVFALARSVEAAQSLENLGARPVFGDLDFPDTLTKAFSEGSAEALINVASLGFGHAPSIIRAAEDAGLDRAVFISTTALFTRLPASTKQVRAAAEDAVRTSRLAWTIIRPTMIYGAPGDRNIARLLTVLRKTPALPVPGGGNRLQQPVHVEDLARATAFAPFADSAVGESINVPGPQAMTFRSLIDTSAEVLGRRPTLVPVPLRPTITALRFYERMARSPRIKAEQVERLAEDKAFDPEKAERLLDYTGRAFRVGVRQEADLLGYL